MTTTVMTRRISTRIASITMTATSASMEVQPVVAIVLPAKTKMSW